MMAYLTYGWIAFYIFAAIWIWGWIIAARNVELEHSDKLWCKIGSYIILFFIWPYIAFCMLGQGDI
jgi:hypothetical protein